MRVYELARECDRSTKDTLHVLRHDYGFSIRSASSTIEAGPIFLSTFIFIHGR